MRRPPALPTPTTPLAMIGTIALTMSALPGTAHAVQVDAEPMPTRTLAPAPTVKTASAPQRSTPRAHTVVRGDTVSGVAARHGLRTADVLTWNGLGWKSIIHPGDVLRLSATTDATERKSGSKAASGSQKSTSRATSSTHTVRAGDTLWAIARTNGVSLGKLLRANDLSSAAIIYPGQKLTVPGTSATRSAPAASTQTSTKQSAPKRAKLDAEQIANAKTIIAVGRDRGVPDKGIAIALATAMVESWIRNLDYGTYDSLGLFQQRPSTGWGSADEVRDAHRSSAAFFGGPSDPNGSDTRGLLDIPGWKSMEFGEAAQAVQRSAHPDRYGQWETQAYAWLDELG